MGAGPALHLQAPDRLANLHHWPEHSMKTCTLFAWDRPPVQVQVSTSWTLGPDGRTGPSGRSEGRAEPLVSLEGTVGSPPARPGLDPSRRGRNRDRRARVDVDLNDQTSRILWLGVLAGLPYPRYLPGAPQTIENLVFTHKNIQKNIKKCVFFANRENHVSLWCFVGPVRKC